MTIRHSQRAGIVQFGTGRFLLAHVDALVSESLAAGESQDRILVVQSSNRDEGKRKARLLAARRHYPVRIRGYRNAQRIDTEQSVTSVADCLIAAEQWPALERHMVESARIVVSNTGDTGYTIGDDSSLAEIPWSFPGKLTKLLRARFDAGGDGLTLLPCELIEHNARRLKALVFELARRDGAGKANTDAFLDWLETRCVWVDTLVDRIVSSALEPLGAVAEPYALWAIARQPGMAIPCRHADVEIVEDLAPRAMCKLHILNLAHSFLVHHWQRGGFDRLQFVREAMATPALLESLQQVFDDEVLPALATQRLPMGQLIAYRDATLERFANPFLDHRLVDIAQNHHTKLERRLRPVVEMARQYGLATPSLDAALAEPAWL
ncbi:mannitol dehydrogenase [Halomonas sp. IOP_31]|uniref:mannitol dehydrogenase family protein n=1 Tax=Halomonas sp. IOP_31 TaxID=2876584 RepID=UPI001E6207D9|nr:mannitol dehydrogenase [Halomonas sp. IOP_31]